jgi:hypothetical protein
MSLRRRCFDQNRGNIAKISVKAGNIGKKSRGLACATAPMLMIPKLAGTLEMRVADLVETLETIQQTLNKLTGLYPTSLLYGDDEAEVP